MALAVLGTLFFVMGTSWADIAMPVVRDRCVLLLPAEDLRYESLKNQRSIHVASLGRTFAIDRLFLQDRIASQGIDVADFSAAEQRISDIEKILAQKSAPKKLLIELVLVRGSTEYVISYLKPFDAEAEYSRYFPVRSVADVIAFNSAESPSSAALWEQALDEQTVKEKRRLMLGP